MNVPYACAVCWERRHKCKHDFEGGACRGCRSHRSVESTSDLVDYVGKVPPFNFEVLWGYLAHKNSSPFTQEQLGAWGSDSNMWNIDFTTTAKTATSPQVTSYKLSLHQRGDLSTSNYPFIAAIDDFFRRSFADGFQAKTGASMLISQASLVCAYARCVFAVTEIGATVTMLTGGQPFMKTFSAGDVGARFMLLLFQRMAGLVRDTLTSIFEVDNGSLAYENKNAYAAAVILYHDLFYMLNNLKHGHFRQIRSPSILCSDESRLTPRSSPALPQQVIDWLSTATNILAAYIKSGCGKHIKWREPVSGSFRDLTHKHRAETYNIQVALCQILFVSDGEELEESHFGGIAPGSIDCVGDSTAKTPSPVVSLMTPSTTDSHVGLMDCEDSSSMHDSSHGLIDGPVQVGSVTSPTSSHDHVKEVLHGKLPEIDVFAGIDTRNFRAATSTPCDQSFEWNTSTAVGTNEAALHFTSPDMSGTHQQQVLRSSTSTGIADSGHVSAFLSAEMDVDPSSSTEVWLDLHGFAMLSEYPFHL